MYQHQETFVSHATSSDSIVSTLGHVVRTFLPGVGQGATTVLLGHPLDTAKTRLQALGPHIHSSSVFQSVIEIGKQEGIRGLYRGAAPPILMEGAKRGLQFGLWDIFKGYGAKKDAMEVERKALHHHSLPPHQHQQHHPTPTRPPPSTSTTDSSSKSLWSVERFPSSTSSSEGGKVGYAAAAAPAVTTPPPLHVKTTEEGNSPHGSASPPLSSSSSFSTSSQLRHVGAELLGVVGRSSTLSGALAGGIGTFIGCPMHVIKIQTQNQTSHGTRNAWTCTQDIWRREGFFGFYRGLQANMLKDVFFAGTYLGLYTNFRGRLQARHLSLSFSSSLASTGPDGKGELLSSSSFISACAVGTVGRGGGGSGSGTVISPPPPLPPPPYSTGGGDSSLFLRSDPALTFIAASSACMLTWIFLYPLDTMKTLIQSGRLSSITSVRAAHFSIPSIYRGLTASLWRAGPIAGLAMLAYEELKIACRSS